MATRVTDGAKRETLFSSRAAALVSRVSRLRRSRARALLSLNLKKKRDCSQSTIKSPIRRDGGLWVTELIAPNNLQEVWARGGLPCKSARDARCLALRCGLQIQGVWDGKSPYLPIQVSPKSVHKEIYKKCPHIDHTGISFRVIGVAPGRVGQ